jgi:cytidylate kinase
MPPLPLVLVSGLTAAGKTTHCQLLANALGWDYVSMSQVRRLQIPESSSQQHEWLPEGDERRAANAMLDLEMDRRIAEHIEHRDAPTVIDAWLQPWLCDLPAVHVWLDSDFGSRVSKAQVSRLRAGLAPSPTMTETVAEKDKFSIEHFRRLYGIEFGPDPGIFDLFLDNSAYLTEANIRASDDGIRRFSPIFNAAVSTLVQARSDGD